VYEVLLVPKQQFGTSAEVSRRHFVTGAEVSRIFTDFY